VGRAVDHKQTTAVHQLQPPSNAITVSGGLFFALALSEGAAEVHSTHAMATWQHRVLLLQLLVRHAYPEAHRGPLLLDLAKNHAVLCQQRLQQGTCTSIHFQIEK
jgi:hypothetical protein